MKKATHIIIPILLIIAIVLCSGWYLLVYDREFTRDLLLNFARYFENNGNHTLSSWFYDRAYNQIGDNDIVAIELANQHIAAGNYTKAEYILSKAIASGAGVDVYVALCRTYVEQDKLLDAVNMLNYVSNPEIREQLEEMRPEAPTCTPDPITGGAYYNQYITITVSAKTGKLYVNTNGEMPSVEQDLYTKDITLVGGENHIHAIAIADNGLVSKVSVFGFIVGGVIEEVHFNDSALEEALRAQLNVPADKTLYTNDLWTIEEFTLPDGAASLEDLRHLSFLKKLTIQDSKIQQFAPLSQLSSLTELVITGTSVSEDGVKAIGSIPNLQRLTLSNCSLSTISGLENARGLTYLDLNNNAIRNLSPISGLKKLSELNLAHNAIDELSALSGLSALVGLDISYNNIASLAPITNIVALRQLNAQYNQLTDIAGIEKLLVLEQLGVANNSISDLAPLANTAKLQVLHVAYNNITDISVLSELDALTVLNFANNQVATLPTFSENSQLVYIDGSYNQISSLQPLKGIANLNYVLMDHNKNIRSVSELASCPRLIQVNVYGTKVTRSNAKVLEDQSIIVNYTPTN